MSGEQFISPKNKWTGRRNSRTNDDLIPLKKVSVFPVVYLVYLLSSISFICSILDKSKYA